MPSPQLLLEADAGVLTLTLNRPDKLNAIDNPLAEALLEALDGAAADPSVRAIRLRGKGRAFCAGRDVGAAPTDKDLVLVQAVSRAIVAHPRPVIAAVHGWTVGAGFEWMMNADIALAAADAKFKLPEASLGVFVTGGLVTTLPSAIGPMRAKALMLLGETFDAAQALDWGLVYRCVPAHELDAVSLAAARQLADLNPQVASEFKRVLNLIGLERFDRAMEEECRVQRLLGHRPGTKPA
jgi:enoyl-CoA hydratase/carnithine racemase